MSSEPSFIDLTEYVAPRGRPIPADSRSNDQSFQHVAIVVSDMDAIPAAPCSSRAAHMTGPQRIPDWNDKKLPGGFKRSISEIPTDIILS